MRHIQSLLPVSLLALAFTISGAVAADAPGAKEPAAPGIAVVHTWGDLLAVKPIVLAESVIQSKDGPPVYRIGIDCSTANHCSGAILYCLGEGAGSGESDANGNSFGPFHVVIQKPGEEKIVVDAKQQIAKELIQGNYFLFTKIIPLDSAGTYIVTVQEPLDAGTKDITYRTVATATIKVGNEPGSYWSPLTEYPGSEAESKPAAPAATPAATATGGNAGTAAAAIVEDDLYNAPSAQGTGIPTRPAWQPFPLKKLPDAKIALPQLFPTTPDPGCKLSVSGNRLIIDFDKDIDLNPQPENDYLVRWWINGKPFLPDTKVEPIMESCCGGATSLGRQQEFGIRFHPELLHAKKGDTIAVQILYCPQGWEYVSPVPLAELAKAAMAIEASDDLPAICHLSNRAEFIYTGNPTSMAPATAAPASKQ